ncbi:MULTISPECIES: 16S rRNA (adenine(1518)-N(6)/adenine(1519)-N(6))-dimethyltransferase RsmA [Methanobacterium]|uniref:Probable ribosomal RNA small subunit methyltransferase A n=1 Tax=Methanobacterium bryantii TaxID=2161 RepID=A0A2A2H6M4_METBR|nr:MULTISPECIES: 16S rRNA (adenine(1518)-N(6)/adenine(1519)-N(6))-dimethyltransferase RsmA [Methanobacterium]OEC85932.1 16S rRNA (adenine(1518)-N(6)/adenine(1519)-N(6))-dimethyltransferase [Methanobacterium sp. A39]PAV04913.1 16S rRNA methyltransferase [Methanobacterium bryantii]
MLVKETLKILKENDIRLDKRKGQNYLIDSNILNKIVDYADLSSEDTVLEIGAGIGTLTIPLAEHAKKVIAVEQDQKIAAVLNKRLKKLNISNVEVMVADAVKTDFPYFNKVVSNLPYKISSPITFKLLEYDFDFAVLMYQLEFAERMVAKPGESNYSRLSLMMSFCGDVEMLFEVSKHAFFPNPKISSAVIKLVPNKNVEIDEFFIKVSRALFQHKKKKVRNALLNSFHEIASVDKKEAKEIVSKLDENLLSARVVKLDPAEVMVISGELKHLIR